MTPELNIYGLTKHRDEVTINRFIDRYVDRIRSENREDEQLMLVPLADSKNHLDVDDYDWEPAQTLTHIVKRGLDYPRRAFTVYLVSKNATIGDVILSFTTDDQLIIGLSIDDEGLQSENGQRAKNLLNELMREFHCHLGLVLVDLHPPANESEFLAQSSSEFTVFYKAVESFNDKSA